VLEGQHESLGRRALYGNDPYRPYRTMVNPGDRAHGQQVFTSICTVCHTVKGQGGKIGPVLDGAGANGVEALLRNLLTPNAAMEAGYRQFRVETRDGEVQEGLVVSQDDNTIVLRQPKRSLSQANFTLNP
jgi:putative heme-binding domain-containing protein